MAAADKAGIDKAGIEELLALFAKLTGHLARLTELARRKADVVRKDDLLGLDDVLRHEQALALSIRGLEQRRLELLRRLGLESVPLLEVYSQCPPELQQKARQTTHELHEQYQLYSHAAEAARNTLELNLHEIEKILAAAGVENVVNAGYTAQAPEPPRAMKTDFHA